MAAKSSDDSGLTLMELVVVIAILAITAAVGVPKLKDQLSQQRLKSTARDIYAAYQLAKLDAVKDNENVVVLFSPAAYLPEGNNGVYQLFADNGAGGGTAGNMVQDGSEPTLMSVTMSNGVSLISAAFTDGVATTDKVGFDGQGLPAGSFSGVVVVRTADRWYRVNLSVAGNVNMQISDDGVNWSL